MNRLVIIGNGFDMAHDLKTSYKDFIFWYCNQRVNAFSGNLTRVSKDILCKFIINEKSKLIRSWDEFFHKKQEILYPLIPPSSKFTPYGIIHVIMNDSIDFSYELSQFFKTLLQSIDTKGWVDIENDYYQLLKTCASNHLMYNCSVKDLNDQLAFLQGKLIEYLRTIETDKPIEELDHCINQPLNIEDYSTFWKMRQKQYITWGNSYPERTMILSFNYTATVKLYKNDNFIYNYIHGDLEHPENIIFG